MKVRWEYLILRVNERPSLLTEEVKYPFSLTIISQDDTRTENAIASNEIDYHLMEMMTRLGKEGWELTSVTTAPLSKTLYFKASYEMGN